ncbi:hypothetical protein [Rhodocyclus purpureus]|uniref:hypothetical protein n=1 Tax=Rhodocyclus purpureus TaxID=1067 RepID=UPI0019126B77|nr:hypothetical protein [Rhodocyclus purpureus]
MNENRLYSKNSRDQEKKFDVNLYAVVRLRKKNVCATTEEEAILKAVAALRSEDKISLIDTAASACNEKSGFLGDLHRAEVFDHERGEATPNNYHTDGDRGWLPGDKPRVLIIVQGGVADFVADNGIDVAIFDRDDFASDPNVTEKAPSHFADLAIISAVPYRTIDS